MRSLNTLNSTDNNQNIVWDKGAYSLITQTCSYYITSRVFRNAQEWQYCQYWHQRLYYVKTKKSSDKCYPTEYWTTGPLMNPQFQIQHSSGSRIFPRGYTNSPKCYYFSNFWPQTAWKWKNFWTRLTYACKTKTLGSLHSHALLILAKSSNSKNQVDRSLKISQVAKPLMPILALLPTLFN